MYSLSPIRSLDYFLTISYYLTKRAKKLRGKARGGKPGDDDTPGFGDIDPLDIPGEPAGIWMGRGTSMIGLRGIVLPTHLKRVLRGLHPKTQEPLVKNAKRVKPKGPKSKRTKKAKAGTKRARRPGWDGTFSPPKDVSVLWAVGRPFVRTAIAIFVEQAVRETVDDFMTQFVFTRRRKGKDVEYIPGVPVVAAFPHSTSRAGDPQLHIHTLLVNLVGLPDGTFGALHSQFIYRKKKLIGAYFRQLLVYKLRTKLGVLTERDGQSFRVCGPDSLHEVSDHFSKRSKDIQKHCQDRGERSAIAKEKAALATRLAKELGDRPRRELFERCKAEALALGLTEKDIDQILGTELTVDPDAPKKAVDTAIDNLLQVRSHFSKRALERHALYAAVDHTVHPDKVLAEVERRLTSDPEVEFLINENGHKRYTTKKRLAAEQELLQIAKRLSERPQHVASSERIQKILRDRPTIRPDQAKALRYLATTPSSIRILKGPAGSGKTYVQQALAETFGGLLDSEIAHILRGSPRRSKSSIQQALTKAAESLLGLRVIAAAPTGKATDILAQATGAKEAYTLDILLGDFGQDMTVAHYLGKTALNLVRAARKKPTFRPSKPKPIPLDRNTLVIVDEASMLGFDQALKLLRHIEESGATLILIGDDFQKMPVGRQSVFSSLAEYLGHTALTVITRQDALWARKLVEDLQNGDVDSALEALQKNGRLTVADDPLPTIVWDWWHHAAAENPEDALILVKTNREVEELNDLCQETLRRNGRLHGRAVKIIDRQRRETYRAKVQVGDRVIFTRNSNKYRDGFHVRNGHRGTVVATTSRKISVRLDAQRDDWKIKLSATPSPGTIGQARLHGSESVREPEREFFFPDKKKATDFLKVLERADIKATLHAPKKYPRRTVVVSPKKFPHIRRGYSATDCKAQGDTLRFMFSLLGQDHPSSLVQSSRHKRDFFAYVPTELWQEIAPGKRHIVDIMKQRPDRRLATDLKIRAELAEHLQLTDRLYNTRDSIFVRTPSGPFTWEPAEVTLQDNSLDLHVLTKYTRTPLCIPRAELRTHVLPELAREDKRIHSREVRQFERARDLEKNPPQPGDEILYGLDEIDAKKRFYPADVKERREDGSLTIIFRGTEIEIPADEIPSCIKRTCKAEEPKPSILKAASKAAASAASAPPKKDIPKHVSGRPRKASSISPTAETTPENIVRANGKPKSVRPGSAASKDEGKQRQANSKRKETKTSRPTAPSQAEEKPVRPASLSPTAGADQANVVRATAKPNSDGSQKRASQAREAQEWTDKKRSEAADSAKSRDGNKLKANAPKRHAEPQASTAEPQIDASEKIEAQATSPTPETLPANFHAPQSAASRAAQVLGSTTKPIVSIGTSAWNRYSNWREKKRQRLDKHISSFSVGDQVCFGYPVEGLTECVRVHHGRVVSVTPTKICVQLESRCGDKPSDEPITFRGKQTYSLFKRPSPIAYWPRESVPTPPVKSRSILRPIYAIDRASAAAYEEEKRKEREKKEQKQREDQRRFEEQEARRRKPSNSPTALSQTSEDPSSHPSHYWDIGDRVSIDGDGSHKVVEVLREGLIVSREDEKVCEFFDWDRVDASLKAVERGHAFAVRHFPESQLKLRQFAKQKDEAERKRLERERLEAERQEKLARKHAPQNQPAQPPLFPSEEPSWQSTTPTNPIPGAEQHDPFGYSPIAPVTPTGSSVSAAQQQSDAQQRTQQFYDQQANERQQGIPGSSTSKWTIVHSHVVHGPPQKQAQTNDE